MCLPLNVGFTVCDREPELMRISFLGLGAIGRLMAAHLAARASITVWNRTAKRAREFAASHGAVAAQTPREAAANAEVVITCLPTSREVELVLEGPEGPRTGTRSRCASDRLHVGAIRRFPAR